MKYGQAGKPSGFIGRIMGLIMERVNGKEISATLSRLKIKPSDKVLEIGFGPGKSFIPLAKLVENGRIYGLDHSETMMRMANKRNKKLINDGKLELQLGSIEELNFSKESIDKILTINCIYFWEDTLHSLKKIHETLTKNGIIAITVRNSNHGLNRFYTEETLQELLHKSGYSEINVEFLRKERISNESGY